MAVGGAGAPPTWIRDDSSWSGPLSTALTSPTKPEDAVVAGGRVATAVAIAGQDPQRPVGGDGGVAQPPGAATIARLLESTPVEAAR